MCDSLHVPTCLVLFRPTIGSRTCVSSFRSEELGISRPSQDPDVFVRTGKSQSCSVVMPGGVAPVKVSGMVRGVTSQENSVSPPLFRSLRFPVWSHRRDLFLLFRVPIELPLFGPRRHVGFSFHGRDFVLAPRPQGRRCPLVPIHTVRSPESSSCLRCPGSKSLFFSESRKVRRSLPSHLLLTRVGSPWKGRPPRLSEVSFLQRSKILPPRRPGVTVVPLLWRDVSGPSRAPGFGAGQGRRPYTSQ